MEGPHSFQCPPVPGRFNCEEDARCGNLTSDTSHCFSDWSTTSAGGNTTRQSKKPERCDRDDYRDQILRRHERRDERQRGPTANVVADASAA